MGEYFIPLDERRQAIGTHEAAIVLDLHWRHFASRETHGLPAKRS